MKRIIFITLLIMLMVPASAKVARFDPTVYTENPKCIVDETMQKVKNPFLRKKLQILEQELEVEIKKQREVPNVRYKNL